MTGPIIIHGPATGDYDLDLGVLPFTDWFHATTFTVNHATLHAKGPPTADNLLINGSMTSAAGGKYAVTTLTPGKTHRLRLVNMGINQWVHVGIDNHPFTVIAADFVPVEPFQATSLNIAVGKFIRASFPMRMRMHMHACKPRDSNLTSDVPLTSHVNRTTVRRDNQRNPICW